MQTTIPNRASRNQRHIIALLGGLFATAMVCVHLRVQATLVGYEIGRLKKEESRLLEERGQLRVQLSKLTSRKHLTLMSEAQGTTRQNRLASQ